MKKSIGISLLAVIFLNACGPSKEELAIREKAKNDSIALASQQELLRQQEEEKQLALLKQQLIDLKSQLAGEEAKLQSIEEFKLLRSPDEKAQQITDQTKVIEELKAQIEEIESQLK